MRVYIEWWEGDYDDTVHHKENFQSLEDAVKWCEANGRTDQKIYFEDPALASVVVFLSPARWRTGD